MTMWIEAAMGAMDIGFHAGIVRWSWSSPYSGPMAAGFPSHESFQNQGSESRSRHGSRDLVARTPKKWTPVYTNSHIDSSWYEPQDFHESYTP